jgi:hypothetical protein
MAWAVDGPCQDKRQEHRREISARHGFAEAPEFGELVRWQRLDCGVRVFMNVPSKPAPDDNTPRENVLVLFATPNGNTIEQSLGCSKREGLDYRYDIQHVAAQIRQLRSLDNKQGIHLAVVQSPKLSWPAFRQAEKSANEIIAGIVRDASKDLGTPHVVLSCHSGGGSFLFGYIDAHEEIPAAIERIVFLDANYSYSDDKRHGDKLLAWLKGDAARRLVTIAYDDREITSGGKKVVGPTGGTFRATQRMLARFRKDVQLDEQKLGPFVHTRGLNGQIEFFVHPNPENKILHTALVGEMNGLLQGLTVGTSLGAETGLEAKWGTFGGPRSYTKWVQKDPTVEPAQAVGAPKEEKGAGSEQGKFNGGERPGGSPPVSPFSNARFELHVPKRPADAATGTQFRDRIASLPRAARETAILKEISGGNVPGYLRRLRPLHVEATDDRGGKHQGTVFVAADYLAVGNDDDFIRLPMSPVTALAIADAWGGSLITAKISDDVFRAAEVRIAPHPLTQDRETVATFYEHHRLIEKARRNHDHVAKAASDPLQQDKMAPLLVAGIKKDIVLTNRLKEKANRIALYGWHQPDGKPIQSLYVGHVDWYTDYSHGIRLMSGRMLVDGQERDVSEVLSDPLLCGLLSNEGPLDPQVVKTLREKVADVAR